MHRLIEAAGWLLQTLMQMHNMDVTHAQMLVRMRSAG
jgi:hypothetical protein